MPWYKCTVNEVGPAIDGTETTTPVVYINLTDLEGSFANTWFYAVNGGQDQILDAGIAAIVNNSRVQVAATTPNAGGSPYTDLTRMYEVRNTPAPPSDLHLVSISPNPQNAGQSLINVAWQDNSDDEDGFYVIFKQNPYGLPAEYILPAGTVTLSIPCDDGYDYTISVSARNDVDYSASVSIVVTVP